MDKSLFINKLSENKKRPLKSGLADSIDDSVLINQIQPVCSLLRNFLSQPLSSP